jgi:cysteinyl-tRNA synthetase
MDVWLYDTKGREKKLFSPLIEGRAGMYTCGPTVYGRAHLGNLRAYLFADTLKRVLNLGGFTPYHVMNITDVGHLTSDADDGDDKLVIGARREMTTAWVIARRYEEQFFQDCEALNISRPSVVCRATEHIPEQIDMIKELDQGGFCYRTSDGLYFDTSKYAEYGELARLDVEGLRAGERVSFGEKKNKTDFALWKFSPENISREMEWDAPWGKGFPGWHIECSAMARRYLGTTLDIHTGGTDHIPIHHTNEIAQSECANHTRPFVRYWMHCQFLVLPSGEKVAKSSGHVLSVDTLKGMGLDPLAYRYLCLTAHYRNYLNYSETAIRAASQGLSRLRQLCRACGYISPAPENDIATRAAAVTERVRPSILALLDDLNTPQALVAFREFLKSADVTSEEKILLIEVFDYVTGLDLSRNCAETFEEIPDDIIKLADQRTTARSEKDWSKADLLRRELEELGFILDDLPSGTRISRKNDL